MRLCFSLFSLISLYPLPFSLFRPAFSLKYLFLSFRVHFLCSCRFSLPLSLFSLPPVPLSPLSLPLFLSLFLFRHSSSRSPSQSISFPLFPCPFSMFLSFLPSPLTPLTSSCSSFSTLATLFLSLFLFRHSSSRSLSQSIPHNPYSLSDISLCHSSLPLSRLDIFHTVLDVSRLTSLSNCLLAVSIYLSTISLTPSH